MANCRASNGPYGSGWAIEPIVLIAAGTLGSWASTQGEDQPPPAGVAQLVGELLDVEVAEDGDQRVRGDRQQGQVEHRTGGDPAQLDQRLLLGTEQRAQPVAHVVELDVGVVEGVARRQEPSPPPAGTAAPPAGGRRRARGERSLPRALLADQQHERAEQLRLVVAGVAGRLGHGGGRQVAEAE